MVKQVGKLDKEIEESSVVNAKKFRQHLVNEFDKLIKTAVPDIKKGGGHFWTAPLNEKVYFYVSFELPKHLKGDSTLSIFYGIENRYTPPSENMIVRQERYIKYPYALHHQLFEFNNVARNKEKVGFFYWTLLMQKKKLHYYTEEQTEYVIKKLFPVAIEQLARGYAKLYSEFYGTSRELPDIRVASR